MGNIIFSDKTQFERKKKKILAGGWDKFQVLADFDRTVTCGLDKSGKRTPTVISKLRSDEKYLGAKYKKEAEKLFDIYHPIEIDNSLPMGEKITKMREWWVMHFNLISKSGLNKSIILQVVKEKPLDFREGVSQFVNCLYNRGTPLIFMSAGPGDIILEYLKQNKLMKPNIFVVANKYTFDEKGNAMYVQEPIIHTFNKTEITLKGLPLYEEVKKRKNVLLLGDQIGDVGMIEGFDYDNLICVGFLNENIEENLALYKKRFDVVITNDGTFGFLNDFLKDFKK